MPELVEAPACPTVAAGWMLRFACSTGLRAECASISPSSRTSEGKMDPLKPTVRPALFAACSALAAAERAGGASRTERSFFGARRETIQPSWLRTASCTSSSHPGRSPNGSSLLSAASSRSNASFIR
eukprot:scaffold32301_cov135-Isochrysis_galbana.AAC.20